MARGEQICFFVFLTRTSVPKHLKSTSIFSVSNAQSSSYDEVLCLRPGRGQLKIYRRLFARGILIFPYKYIVVVVIVLQCRDSNCSKSTAQRNYLNRHFRFVKIHCNVLVQGAVWNACFTRVVLLTLLPMLP